MSTATQEAKDVSAAIRAKIELHLDSLDMDRRYDDMLDECYSLDSVGGPFACMCASHVLEKCDPVAYRCGFSDYLDAERDIVVEVNGDYYDREACEKIAEEFKDALTDEFEELEGELCDLEDVDGRDQNRILALKELIALKQAEIDAADAFEL